MYAYVCVCVCVYIYVNIYYTTTYIYACEQKYIMKRQLCARRYL